MVKIRVTIIKNVNIFTLNEILFEDFITILLIMYHNNTKIPGQNRKRLVYL